MKLKGEEKFKVKLTRGLKNDIGNLVNFHASSRKSEHLHFDGLLLSKAYKFFRWKVRKSYASWHWRVMQNLNKADFLFQKWHEEFSEFNASSGKSEICTLMGYFCQNYVMLELKKYRRVVSWKMTYGLKNDIRNLVDFKVENNVR